MYYHSYITADDYKSCDVYNNTIIRLIVYILHVRVRVHRRSASTLFRSGQSASFVSSVSILFCFLVFVQCRFLSTWLPV